MEESLTERFDSVLAAIKRFKPGDSLVGCKSRAASLCKVLEEVFTLFSWDIRPVLHKPFKKGKNAKQKFGNSVVVVSPL